MLLSQEQVIQIVGLSRQEIWRRRHSGDFPEPIRLGTRRIAFLKSEIEEWIAARISERDKK
ncbi:MAG: AlpA family phage regulatory protein [Pseudomonadota bacterium]